MKQRHSRGSSWLKAMIRSTYNGRGVKAFLLACGEADRLLDVGCGNNAPLVAKSIRPDLYYIGIDVSDHRQGRDPRQVADEYRLVPPGEFAAAIGSYKGALNAVVSAHNLEHCDQPDAVLVNMIDGLKPGGRIYLSFPAQASRRFPRRRGTLNFYDDETHREPPDYRAVCASLNDKGLQIEFAAERYRPMVKWLVGLALEPVSRLRNRVMFGTWAFYGFETVIWARRPAGSGMTAAGQ